MHEVRDTRPYLTSEQLVLNPKSTAHMSLLANTKGLSVQSSNYFLNLAYIMRISPENAEAFGGDGWDGELLPAGALLTGSEEYYPTVAINALMRSLRDAALSSQHFEVSMNISTTIRHLHSSESAALLS